MNPADLLRAIDHAHHSPDAACPRCQRLIDYSSSLEEPGAKPKPGDVSVCVNCEATLEYQVDASAALSFRVMTDAEVAALPNEVLLSLLDAIEGARIMHKASEAISASTQPDQHELR